MTKLELYNQICELLPDEFTKQESIKSYVSKMYSLIEKEIQRNASSLSFQRKAEFYAADIEESLLGYSFRFGIITTLNAIADQLGTSNNEYDLFADIKKEMEISVHNFNHRANRPDYS